jgi:hypothetical protein
MLVKDLLESVKGHNPALFWVRLDQASVDVLPFIGKFSFDLLKGAFDTYFGKGK